MEWMSVGLLNKSSRCVQICSNAATMPVCASLLYCKYTMVFDVSRHPQVFTSIPSIPKTHEPLPSGWPKYYWHRTPESPPCKSTIENDSIDSCRRTLWKKWIGPQANRLSLLTIQANHQRLCTTWISSRETSAPSGSSSFSSVPLGQVKFSRTGRPERFTAP